MPQPSLMHRSKLEKFHVAANPNVGWKQIGKRIVVVQIEKGKYYVLENEAAILWRWLVELKSISFVKNKLLKQFKVSQSQADQYVSEFVNQLSTQSLLDLK